MPSRCQVSESPLTTDLFENGPDVRPSLEVMAEGAVLLRAIASPLESELVAALHGIAVQAPFRHMVTPGGHRMSVAMTNCGSAGWITDRTGCRYGAHDPETGKAWPDMPPAFRDLAGKAADRAGFSRFSPDVCLINRYVPGARMSLHQDRDELDFGAPIVSVSLGLPDAAPAARLVAHVLRDSALTRALAERQIDALPAHQGMLAVGERRDAVKE